MKRLPCILATVLLTSSAAVFAQSGTNGTQTNSGESTTSEPDTRGSEMRSGTSNNERNSTTHNSNTNRDRSATGNDDRTNRDTGAYGRGSSNTSGSETGSGSTDRPGTGTPGTPGTPGTNSMDTDSGITSGGTTGTGPGTNNSGSTGTGSSGKDTRTDRNSNRDGR
jgi:hypothetical protein